MSTFEFSVIKIRGIIASGGGGDRGFSFGPIRVTIENLFNSLLEPYLSSKDSLLGKKYSIVIPTKIDS